MNLPNIDFTKTEAYLRLQNNVAEIINGDHLSVLFEKDPKRFEKYSIEWEGIFLDYSKNLINDKCWGNLLSLAKETGLEQGIKALFNGDPINRTENRSVMHMALRAPSDSKKLINGENIIPIVHDELNKMSNLARQILDGKWTGYSGKKIQNVINIGIGGSDLGPFMVTEALKNHHQHLQIKYISNIDPNQLLDCLNGFDPESTLFLVVSKTFSTLETMSNAETAKNWLLNYCPDQEIALNKHFIAISNDKNAVKKFGIKEDNLLQFWDWVGGRYSVWSSVGFSTMLAIGPENFQKLLYGAHQVDKHFENESFERNIPVVLALIDIWYQSFMDCDSHAIVPYFQHLWKFPAFLQQLEMESNGKNTNRNGDKINYQTGGIIWGETGTNSQHAYFQLFHQGTKLIPIDFIGIINDPAYQNFETKRKILLASIFAQSRALMEGTISTNHERDPFKQFEGNKPSTIILLNELSPEQLGKLIAIYEHKVFVQGLIWNIFSFDQWGVELGKKITLEILTNLNVPTQDKSTTEWDASTQGLIEIYQKWQQ